MGFVLFAVVVFALDVMFASRLADPPSEIHASARVTLAYFFLGGLVWTIQSRVSAGFMIFPTVVLISAGTTVAPVPGFLGGFILFLLLYLHAKSVAGTLRYHQLRDTSIDWRSLVRRTAIIAGCGVVISGVFVTVYVVLGLHQGDPYGKLFSSVFSIAWEASLTLAAFAGIRGYVPKMFRGI